MRAFVNISVASMPSKKPDETSTYLAVTVGINAFLQPFYHSVNNKLETFVLFCCFCISILNVILNAPDFFGIITAGFAFAPLGPLPWLLFKFGIQKAGFELVTEEKAIAMTQEMRGHKVTSSHDFSHLMSDASKDTIRNAVAYRIWYITFN